MGKHVPIMKEALRKNRDAYVIGSGPLLGWFGGSVRRTCEGLLKQLDTDYIDVFHLYWLGVTSSWADRTVDEMVKLREEGKIRAFGTSIHDRVRAGELAKESPLDLFMIRYNAAHPGAERDIFPHLSVRQPSVVAYTATAWRKLLKRPSGWAGQVMTAGDCYRFCLTNDHVDVVLTGPASKAELEENLTAVERGPLSPEELS
ncbi:MAG: aldo/keto reductase [Polyangiaceae bacterium]